MSLVAWYKFDGNGNDSSGNNLNATIHNATSTTNGKIKSCYYFNGTNSWIRTGTVPECTSYTISLWFYVNSFTNGQRLFWAYGSDAAILHLSTNNKLGFYIKTSNGGNGYFISNGSWNSNKWNHVVLRYDGNKINLFINGVQDLTEHDVTGNVSSFSLALGTNYNASGNWFNGLIDDVRIYNNALTSTEIKELSKAKILHYQFNSPEEEPTINQANTDSKRLLNPYSSTIMITDDAPEKGDGWKKVTITKRGTNHRIAMFPYISHPTNTTKTYSVEYDFGETTGYYWRLDGYSGGKGGSGITVQGRHQITATTTSDSGNLSMFLMNPTYNNTVNDTIYYRYYQVEEKDHATPFTENVREGFVLDVSGYENHGIIEPLTSPEYTEGIMGKGSFKFGNGPSTIRSNSKTPISNDTLTLSAWVKPTGVHSNDRGIIIQENYNYYLTLTPSQQVSTYWYNTSNQGYHTTTETLPLNEWSLVTAVWNGTHHLIYINGELKKSVVSSTPGKTGGDEYITIGRETTNYRNFNGFIDDVRIYATALSEEDILGLYQTKAKLDQKGNLFIDDIVGDFADEEFKFESESILTSNGINEIGPTEGLVAWYPLDGDVFDYSGYGNDGTITGTPTISSGIGKYKSYYFDGTTGNYIRAKTPPQLNTNNFTWTAWFYRIGDGGSTSYDLFMGSYVPYMGIYTNNRLVFSLNVNGTQRTIYSNASSHPIDFNKWIFYTATYDGTNMKLYYNGDEVASGHYPGTASSGNQFFDIGRSTNLTNDICNGKVSDVRIYNRALSEKEIKILYRMKETPMQIDNGTIYLAGEIKNNG